VASRRRRLDGLASAPADLHLRPPSDGIGGLDFGAGRRLIELGYRYTQQVLEEATRAGCRMEGTQT
jgi:hypothetical protein